MCKLHFWLGVMKSLTCQLRCGREVLLEGQEDRRQGGRQAARLGSCLELSSPNSLSTAQCLPTQAEQRGGVVHSTTRATTHGNSLTWPALCCCCWPTPSWLSIVSIPPPPLTAPHISQLNSTWESFLSRDVLKFHNNFLNLASLFLSKLKTWMFLTASMTNDYFTGTPHLHILIFINKKSNICP